MNDKTNKASKEAVKAAAQALQAAGVSQANPPVTPPAGVIQATQVTGSLLTPRIMTLALSPDAQTGNRRFKKNWFLDHTEDLAVVNVDDPTGKNDALGIKQIQVQRPSDSMYNAGIICKVSMETLTGWDYGITIRESKQTPGDIMLQEGGSREILPKEGETQTKKNFVNDRKFNDATTAQILSFVWKMLVPNAQQPPSQG